MLSDEKIRYKNENKMRRREKIYRKKVFEVVGLPEERKEGMLPYLIYVIDKIII